ncbi:MAG: hypothetical protein IAE85_00745, partial [Anaerolinea sp.]|nr:hypothetical protein [Anaerolinea sp.]
MDALSAVTIGRARVSGVRRPEQALATRLAVAGSLASADLRPPGLPPAAVLIIDQLAPGRPLRPAARVDPGWERAARAAVATLYSRAARPVDGAPPAGCPAVLFR